MPEVSTKCKDTSTEEKTHCLFYAIFRFVDPLSLPFSCRVAFREFSKMVVRLSILKSHETPPKFPPSKGNTIILTFSVTS